MFRVVANKNYSIFDEIADASRSERLIFIIMQTFELYLS